MCDKGIVSRGWEAREGIFLSESLSKMSLWAPYFVGDLVRGIDLDHLGPIDQLRVPDSDHKQMSKQYKIEGVYVVTESREGRWDELVEPVVVNFKVK